MREQYPFEDLKCFGRPSRAAVAHTHSPFPARLAKRPACMRARAQVQDAQLSAADVLGRRANPQESRPGDP